MKHKIEILTRVALIIIVTSGFAQWANAQTVNWMSWNAPTYNLVNTSPSYFTYAAGATGQLTLPDGTVVDVTMNGEVINKSCFTVLISGCNDYFKDINGWSGYPTGTFTSSAVPNLPPNNNQIAQTGYANPTHTMTFSQPVRSVVMNVYSLGGGSTVSAYQFNQDFEILSQNPACTTPQGSNCLWKSGTTLYGKEGAGTVQFTGTYTVLEWTVTQPEYFSGFNIGVSPAGFFPPCSVADALTLSEAEWHSQTSASPLTVSWFSQKFPTGLKLGSGNTVTLTSVDAIRNFLPQGPKSSILGSSQPNPGKKLQNSLAGQLAAAKLNRALSPNLSLAKIPAGTDPNFDGMSYIAVILAADAALGWNGTGTMPSQAYLDSLNNILIYINTSFSSSSGKKIVTCD